MVVIEHALAEAQPIPEAISDASGLSSLHTELYQRATPYEDRSGILTHPDDPSFRFVVGYDGEAQFIKFGDNGVSTLTYKIRDGKVFQCVSSSGTGLSEGLEITDNPGEILAVVNIIQNGV